MPLFHDVDYRLANSKVRGLKLRGSAPYVQYSEIGRVETVAKAPERASGGILQVPIAGTLSFHGLDPSLATTIEDGETLPSIFETLTRDVGEARIVPWLISEFRAEQGVRDIVFVSEMMFAFNDGRKLTARDVRYSFERLLLSSASTGRFFYSAMGGAKALIEGQSSDLIG